MQAGRFVTKEEHVGGTEFKYWQQVLKDLTDEELINGLKGTAEFRGYLTWGEFKKLCLDKPEKPIEYYQPLPRPKLPPEEIKERMRKLREELGL